ncbi:Zn(2+)-responsive transcriptional regulator [Pantoea sp. AS142]|uniref:Zn(2+)-responsive transcriptional regulator n=1 Tax=Pantoea sp. AS142 TaxID=3081292 RepID=UPI00301AC0E6
MFRIGHLAKLAEVTPDTIRFYEKQQMMDHDSRTGGGFRLYSKGDLQRLKFIRHGRKLGFSLEAIRQLLSIRIDPAHHTCQESKAIVEKRLAEVAQMISELETMQHSLRHLSIACCGDSHSSISCSILEALERGEAVSK